MRVQFIKEPSNEKSAFSSETVTPTLKRALDGTAFRLVGVTAHDLVSAQRADPPDLFAGR